jgi:hypothetical protein
MYLLMANAPEPKAEQRNYHQIDSFVGTGDY